MTEIRGIYKIPSQRIAFFIVSAFPDFLDSSRLSQESKKRTEQIVRILQSKDRKIPTGVPQWKLKVVSEHDFLRAIELHTPRKKVSSNQSFDSPVPLELLAINLLETPESLLWTSNTPKALGVVPDEDIIEVFI